MRCGSSQKQNLFKIRQCKAGFSVEMITIFMGYAMWDCSMSSHLQAIWFQSSWGRWSLMGGRTLSAASCSFTVELIWQMKTFSRSLAWLSVYWPPRSSIRSHISLSCLPVEDDCLWFLYCWILVNESSGMDVCSTWNPFWNKNDLGNL